MIIIFILGFKKGGGGLNLASLAFQEATEWRERKKMLCGCFVFNAAGDYQLNGK